MRVLTSALASSSFVVLVLLAASSLEAQQVPSCPTGCLGGVEVTPDGGNGTHPPNSGPWSVEFQVKNLGAKKTYTFSCSSSLGISCVSVVPGSLSLNQNQTTIVEVSYNVGASGGRVFLLATASGASDQGYFTIALPSPPSVTPDAAARLVRPITNAQLPFTIENFGGISATFLLTVSCTGVVTSCSGPAPTSVTLAGGASATAVATFSTGGAGLGTGTLTLTAANQDDPGATDNGSYNMTLGPGGPVVRRDLCLTISAGPGSAYECGDLRLVHPLASVRTLNKTRTPVLIYNSQMAHAYPLVSADVTVPAGSLPDSVRATLTVNSVAYTRSWLGTAWGSGGQTRRVVVGFDAVGANLSTGVHAYQLDVTKYVGGSPSSLLNSSGLSCTRFGGQ